MPPRQQNAAAALLAEYTQLFRRLRDPTREVGGYRIVREIGAGTFGRVYLGVHKLLHTTVVLKQGDSDDPNVVREIYFHRKMRHPCIVRLFEVVVTEGSVWMVMEHCAGGELLDWVVAAHQDVGPQQVEFLLSLARQELMLLVGTPADDSTPATRPGTPPVVHIPVSPKRTASQALLAQVALLFAQVVAALLFVHNANLAHRDLKLENILLTSSNHIRLLDFGFVRELVPKQHLLTVCGLTGYMAPELLRRERYLGRAIDIWALGVILYALVYGQMPFEGADEDATRQHVLDELLPHYPEGPAPPAVVELIQCMLERDPRQRALLTDVAQHPWIAAMVATHSATPPPPFLTKREKKLLRHLAKAGIDTHRLMLAVRKNKCNQLCGFWELSLLKYRQRKQRPRLMPHSLQPPLERIRSTISRRGSVDGASIHSEAVLGKSRGPLRQRFANLFRLGRKDEPPVRTVQPKKSAATLQLALLPAASTERDNQPQPRPRPVLVFLLLLQFTLMLETLLLLLENTPVGASVRLRLGNLNRIPSVGSSASEDQDRALPEQRFEAELVARRVPRRKTKGLMADQLAEVEEEEEEER